MIDTRLRRRVLDLPGASTVIDFSGLLYCLRLRAGDSVDADDVDAAARAALADATSRQLPLLERAASLWGGEPLPEERYSDWALGWRERLTDVYAPILAALADVHLRSGDLAAATIRARDLVKLDVLNEGGHRRLMLAHTRAGQRSQALRQFLACRRASVEQLGVEPAQGITCLQQRILAGESV
jgi:DNA-binding SARP family transcriptional activator